MSLISPRIAMQALLSTISIYAAYTFYQVVGPMGTGKLLVQEARASRLPRRDRYTGVKPVDKLLTNLNYFFWPVMNNHDSKLSLQSLQFAGQVAAIWMMIMYESSRPSIRGKWISYTTILGLVLQTATYAVTLPLWLAAHLAVTSRSSTYLIVKPTNLDCSSIVISIVLGFIIPAVFSALPLSKSLTINDKLGYMAVWQVFPLWTGLFHQLFSFLLPSFSSAGYFGDHFIIKTNKAFYSSVLILAVVSRCLPTIIELYAGSACGMFCSRFPLFHSASKFKTLEEGIRSFLAWDETLGSLSLILWASFDLGSVVTSPSLYQQVQFVGVLGILYVIAGPAGVVVAMRWATDAIRERASLHNAK